jgi:hypothetical protein
MTASLAGFYSNVRKVDLRETQIKTGRRGTPPSELNCHVATPQPFHYGFKKFKRQHNQ